MKRLLLSACVAAFLAESANAGSFSFENMTIDGKLITGSFDGTLSGGLITDLSNISVFIDGVGFAHNGSLFSAHLDPIAGWSSGGAVVSLNGTHSNFIFIDSDFPADASYTNYYYVIDEGLDGLAITGNNMNTGQYTSNLGPSEFTVRIAAVPEPVSWALMLGGFGLVGGMMRTRSRSVRFA